MTKLLRIFRLALISISILLISTWRAFAQTPINCGETITGSISAAGEKDTYTFTVSANDKVIIPLAEISGDLYLELYSPAGTKLAGIDSGRINTTLSVAGTYTLIVRGYYSYSTGNYGITWQKLNSPCNAAGIAYADIISNTITNPAQINAYTFGVSVNHKITVCAAVNSTTSGYFSIYLELYDTAGNLLASASDSLKHTFASTGTFYLFARDYYQDSTGTYRMALLNGDISCSTLDLIDPEVSLIQPKGGEIIENGSPYNITWNSSDDTGITSQEIKLSTDGGVAYPTVIASGLAGSIESYNWPVPADLYTSKGRIKVIARDAQGNQGEDANDNDIIIIKTTLPAEAKEINYEYDRLNRLTGSVSTALPSETCNYDSLGNRLDFLFSPPDTTPPTGSIKINKGATYTKTTSVTLNLSATDTGLGVEKMKFSNNNSIWSTPQAYATTKAWKLTSGKGTKTVYVKYQDKAGNWSSNYSDTIILDTIRPTGSIKINKGATYTKTTKVTLNLSAKDTGSRVGKMRFSNNKLSWSTPQAYATTKAWKLTSGKGTKTVYVKYQDKAGNWSVAYSDKIILKTTP